VARNPLTDLRDELVAVVARHEYHGLHTDTVPLHGVLELFDRAIAEFEAMPLAERIEAATGGTVIGNSKGGHRRWHYIVEVELPTPERDGGDA
jgi:hypothetical protein